MLTQLNQNTFRRSLSTLAKDYAKCYYYGKYSHFKNKCPNLTSVNKVDRDPLEQQDNDNKDTEVTEEETEETLEGNREAQAKTPSQAYTNVIC